MASNCVGVFHFPSVCNIISFALAYVTIGSYIAHVYKGRHTKKMLVINESAHVAVMLQLLEMSSITTTNLQFRMFAQGTFFRKIIGNFTDIR